MGKSNRPTPFRGGELMNQHMKAKKPMKTRWSKMRTHTPSRSVPTPPPSTSTTRTRSPAIAHLDRIDAAFRSVHGPIETAPSASSGTGYAGSAAGEPKDGTNNGSRTVTVGHSSRANGTTKTAAIEAVSNSCINATKLRNTTSTVSRSVSMNLSITPVLDGTANVDYTEND